MRSRRWWIPLIAVGPTVLGVAGCARAKVAPGPTAGGVGSEESDLAAQVEILRTEYGVPHIFAENLRALGFGLGYAQIEDYGTRAIRELVYGRGEMGLRYGVDSIESDFQAKRSRKLAEETYGLLTQDARDLMEGFALGINRFIHLHSDEFADWGRLHFSGVDVHGSFVLVTGPRDGRRFRQRADSGTARIFPAPEEGSNAWAFGPSRTESGHSILLRNPHLSWDAGYYEAHLVVPGTLNWYGDLRIGWPLYYIGGFNERLGWATTNNGPDLDEIYALEADPVRADRYLFDGESMPLEREVITVEYRGDTGVETETRESWTTSLGPVIDRRDEKIFVFTAGYDGAFRMVDQYLGMMRARNLDEWLDAMRMRAHQSSNFTYADADGNIFYLWNAALPSRPHAPAGDTAAVLVHRSSEVWQRLVPFDSLPHLLNPRSGYIHNENDPFYFTNLEQPFDTAAYGPNFPRPNLRLRSQLALSLIHGMPEKVSLEDVIAFKHTTRMPLADRVKDDLVAAVRAAHRSDDVLAAIDVIDRWDNTTEPDRKGAVLFYDWARAYVTGEGSGVTRELREGLEAAFRVPWRSEAPTATPEGLGDPEAAVRAFDLTVSKMQATYGTPAVSWGDVHRARRGDLDLPVGGCPGWVGCFRTLYFEDAEDGHRVVDSGDAWVLAVEFGDIPRAYSVLAYGESAREGSPHSADQLRMFVAGRLKEVAFTDDDIDASLIRRYRPGQE